MRKCDALKFLFLCSLQTRITSTVFFVDWEYEYNGYYYKKSNYETKFDGAKTACASLGAPLAYRTVKTKNDTTLRS